uniref:Uncharacterized protein n=1 Tax=Nelumbo nucifera TaxID=4432 RepID=A0A822XF53_NELNU|nr:TPA_asm: hypothetical protein HUJ06_019995 [Nelumbo nucifera]
MRSHKPLLLPNLLSEPQLPLPKPIEEHRKEPPPTALTREANSDLKIHPKAPLFLEAINAASEFNFRTPTGV